MPAYHITTLHVNNKTGMRMDALVKSTREVGEEKELHALAALANFGYLIPAQLAALAYPAATQATGLRQAGKLLLRLERKGLALRKRGGFSEPDHWAISGRGVRQLRDWAEGWEWVREGHDLVRTPSAHRDAANWLAIHARAEGRFKAVVPERLVQTGRAHFRTLGVKVPDGYAVDASGGVTWFEVENTARGGRDLEKLGRWLVHTAFPQPFATSLNPPHDTLTLRAVRFYISHRSARHLPRRLESWLRRHHEKLTGRPFDPSAWASRLEFQTAWDPATITRGFPADSPTPPPRVVGVPAPDPAADPAPARAWAGLA